MILPWQPLFTTYRSDLPEITVYGIISVTKGKSQQLLSLGDTNAILWSRSLLKPWQLLCLLPTLITNYPQLQPHHLAMMMASHNGEPEQIKYLEQLMSYGQLTETNLQCPSSLPMSSASRLDLKESTSRSIFHPCSGKHIAYLLSLQAQHQQLDTYLKSEELHFKSLKELISWVLYKNDLNLPETIDGCGLPNYGFTAKELSQMFGTLLQSLSKEDLDRAPVSLRPALQYWQKIQELMRQYPLLIGGHKRLDSKLVAGELTTKTGLNIVAKEGADGLLGVGINIESNNLERRHFACNIGILIKLASGYNSHYLEIVISEILKQLELRSKSHIDEQPSHIRREFHFRIDK